MKLICVPILLGCMVFALGCAMFFLVLREMRRQRNGNDHESGGNESKRETQPDELELGGVEGHGDELARSSVAVYLISKPQITLAQRMQWAKVALESFTKGNWLT